MKHSSIQRFCNLCLLLSLLFFVSAFEKHELGNNDAHFSQEGYPLFAPQVAQTIAKHIPQ